MGHYDGPSIYKKEQSQTKPINVKRQARRLPKYELPKTVRTRDNLQKEAQNYMKTPSSVNRRFRSTKIPNSLQHLEGWKQNRHNHQLIQAIRERLMVDSSEYLLFEERIIKEPQEGPQTTFELHLEPELKKEEKPEGYDANTDTSNKVTLNKKEDAAFQFRQKKPVKKQQSNTLDNSFLDEKNIRK